MHKDGNMNAGWLFYHAESTNEYVIAEYDYDNIHGPLGSVIFVLTDQGDFEGVVDTSIEEDLLIDAFENEQLAQRFCSCIEKIVSSGYLYSGNRISNEMNTKIRGWYLGHCPKYGIA